MALHPMLCARVTCDCGVGMVWAAEVQWLAQEGLTMAGTPPVCQRLPLPKDARNVTGLFNTRCPQCLESLPVLPLIRGRLAAGMGVLLDPPARPEALEPSRTCDGSATAIDREARLLNRDGRRARRVKADSGLQGSLTIAFAITILDLSSLGLCAEHRHQVHEGHVYRLMLRLPSHPGAVPLEARVAWTMASRIEAPWGRRQTTYRSGFAFLNVSAETVAALEAYVVARFAGRKSEALAPLPGA